MQVTLKNGPSAQTEHDHKCQQRRSAASSLRCVADTIGPVPTHASSNAENPGRKGCRLEKKLLAVLQSMQRKPPLGSWSLPDSIVCGTEWM